MQIPDYQTVMLPLLEYLADEKEHALREVVKSLAIYFKLSEQQKNETLPGGTKKFANKVGWASKYLKEARLLESPRRGMYKISDRGLDVLASKPASIDKKFLVQFSEFRVFVSKK